jgi:hypothetical protein
MKSQAHVGAGGIWRRGRLYTLAGVVEINQSAVLEHDPEKWAPVFRKDHAQRKKIERDDDSKKSHPAPRRQKEAGGR